MFLNYYCIPTRGVLFIFLFFAAIFAEIKAAENHQKTTADNIFMDSFLGKQITISATKEPISEFIDKLVEKYRKSYPDSVLNVVVINTYRLRKPEPEITVSLSNAPLHFILRTLSQSTGSKLEVQDHTIILTVGYYSSQSETFSFLYLPRAFCEAIRIGAAASKEDCIDWFDRRGIELPKAEKVSLFRSGRDVTLLVKEADIEEVSLANCMVQLVLRGHEIPTLEEASKH